MLVSSIQKKTALKNTTLKNERGNIWFRLLIIVYALGIIAIGAYPIQKRYGGIWGYIHKQSNAFANQDLFHGGGGSILDEPVVKTFTLPNNRGLPAEKSSGSKVADQLTPQDRKQLNKLIDGF